MCLPTTFKGVEHDNKRGRALGRTKLQCPAEWDRVYQEWKAGRTTGAEAGKALSLKRTNFYKLVKEREALTHERAASWTVLSSSHVR